MSVSIVMPCYNEGEVIETVIRSYHKEIIDNIDDSEFIIIDDCSSDNTPEILDRLQSDLPALRVIRPDQNGGHGKAIRLGYDNATKDYVFQVDSDNQFNPQDFPKLYELRNDFDFILGYRVNRNDPVSRLILTRILRLINFIIFGVWIKDANCPYRLIRRESLSELLSEIDKEAHTPNIMLSILAKKRGLRFAEIPISHNERKTGFVFAFSWKLIKFSVTAFFQVLKIR